MAVADFVVGSDLTDYRAGDADTIVAQAQGAIRRYCGWHIAPEVTETITLDGSGSKHLWLPSLHVTDVSEVTDLGDVVDTDDYDWSANGYIQRRSGCWTYRARQVTVTLTHGYSEIPPELVGVAVAVASRKLASLTGARREQAGQVSFEFGPHDLMMDERATLDLFKLPPRP